MKEEHALGLSMVLLVGGTFILNAIVYGFIG